MFANPRVEGALSMAAAVFMVALAGGALPAMWLSLVTYSPTMPVGAFAYSLTWVSAVALVPTAVGAVVGFRFR